MTMKKPLLVLAAVAAVAVPLAVCAQQPSPAPVPPVASAPQAGVTSLTLSVTERSSVKQDVVMANVRYETTGNDARTVQNDINEKIKAGLEAVKGDDAVKIATESYQVYSSSQAVVIMKDGKETTEQKEEWRGSQAITLESTDAEKIKVMTGKLQDLGFVVGQLQYTLSPGKSEEVRQTLLKGAVEKLKLQADQAAKLLGKSGYDIKEINIDGGYIQPIPMFKAMRAEASMASDAVAAPSVEAGESDVTMTVNARVDLK